MKKLFLLVIFSFFLGNFASAQELPNINDDSVPIVGNNCTKSKESGGLGGTCTEANWIFSGAMCEDNQDFVGHCSAGGFFTGQRSDCCVPKGSATPDDVAANTQGQWVSQTQCEKPRTDGGVGGQCLTAKSGVNILDFTDSCSAYPATPRFAGVCGAYGGNSVCCVSEQVAEEVTGDTSTPLATEYGDYQLLEQIPGSSNTSGQLQPYLESLYKAGFVLIVLGAIIMIGLGGFTYMASAGNTSMIKKGKGMITDAIVGLVVALLIWLILNIINPDLVNLRIDPLPTVTFDPGETGAFVADQNAAGDAANGSCTAIPASELTTIDGFQVKKEIAPKIEAMKAAAKQAGFTITLSSGYRSPERQLEIWNGYGCSRVNGKTVCSKLKSGQVALPCSLGGRGSNHTAGTAIDIKIPGCGNRAGCTHPLFKWLKANGATYGFYNNLSSDDIHWSTTGK